MEVPYGMTLSKCLDYGSLYPRELGANYIANVMLFDRSVELTTSCL